MKVSGSLRTRVAVSPWGFRRALYPQMFPAWSYGPDYSHTDSTRIGWWQNPITKFIRGLWPCCLVNKVIMIKKCPWTSLHACAHTHTGLLQAQSPYSSQLGLCEKPALILAIQYMIHLPWTQLTLTGSRWPLVTGKQCFILSCVQVFPLKGYQNLELWMYRQPEDLECVGSTGSHMPRQNSQSTCEMLSITQPKK